MSVEPLMNVPLRSGTAAQWSALNPIQSEGEPGLEVDTGKWKLGDGTTHWAYLAYSPTPAGGGSLPVIGTSYLIATGAAQAGIAAGVESTNVQWTQDTLVGTDIAIDGVDAGLINVLTTGFYQITAYHGINGSGPTSMQLTIHANPAYDNYVGVDPTVGAADLVVTTPVLAISAGGVIRVRVYVDGTGTWNLEASPSQITVMRMA